MANFTEELRGGTDIAALSGAIVAVSVSLFIGSGKYDLLNLVVSFSLIATLIGYVWKIRRSIVQSVAVSSIFGLAAVPGYGFVYEFAQNNYNGFASVNAFVCLGLTRTISDNQGSSVCQEVLALCWLGTTAVVFGIDEIFQRRWLGRKWWGNAVANTSA